MFKRLLALLSMIPFLSAWANKPRLTLYQRWNVATLLTLLEDLPAEKYNHSFFGFAVDRCSHGCAIGLAYTNRQKFVGVSGASTGSEFVNVNNFATLAFGPAAFDTVFDVNAYSLYAEKVPKKMVIDRLKAYAYDGFRTSRLVSRARWSVA